MISHDRGRLPDLTVGSRFSRLVVMGTPTKEHAEERPKYPCKCDCGNGRRVLRSELTLGRVRSCGCLWQEWRRSGQASTTHGMSPHKKPVHPLYRTWSSVKTRCFNPKSAQYPNYGGRGITMWAGWVNDPAAFVAWVETHLGPRREGYSIDRINNDGDYEPGNVRWASKAQQSQNRRDLPSGPRMRALKQRVAELEAQIEQMKAKCQNCL